MIIDSQNNTVVSVIKLEDKCDFTAISSVAFDGHNRTPVIWWKTIT
jgi:hypothetical protein